MKQYSYKATKTENKKYKFSKPGKGTGSHKGLMTALRYLYRLFVVLMTVAVMLAFALLYVVQIIADGPSPAVRNFLVQSAMQASATKWVPGLFLSDEEVKAIIDAGDEQVIEEVDMEDPPVLPDPEIGDDTDEEGGEIVYPIDDGIDYYQISKNTFRAYIMLIKDPSRVFVGVSTNDFESSTRGMRIYDAAKKYGAIAAINAGEFSDTGGQGRGERPMGITFSRGNMVWNDKLYRTFIGLDSNNRLIVKEGMTEDEALLMGIRDGVSFQRGNLLIETVEGSVRCYYQPENDGKAQRTAIGQRADGTIILIVTDGRTTSSIGATRDDIIDLMVNYGAVTAGMLDGGSSAMMYYSNYVEKYSIDEGTLDEYQKLGLVNKYKAFTNPRWLPTFFMVMPEVED